METERLQQSVRTFLRHLSDDNHSAPNTISAYQNDLSQFGRFVAEQDKADPRVQLKDGELVRPELVTAFVFALRERGYSAATIARRIAAVKSFFAYAESAGMVRQNPALALDAPRVTRPARKEVAR